MSLVKLLHFFSEHTRLKKLSNTIFLTISLLTIININASAYDTDYNKDSEVKVDVLAKTDSSWDNSPLPAYPKENPEITILRIKIPPGIQLPMHKHPVINAGVLLKGNLTVITEDNRTLRLKAGESIVEVVNTWHYGINDGNVTAELIMFYAGTKETPITVKKQVKSPQQEN